MAENFESLHSIAAQIRSALERSGLKCAFAESCTGGMVAAAMTGVPGVSSFLCGSQVTYRVDSKSSWLGVDPALIASHTAESAEVTEAMASGLLEKTPEADVAVAVTGHLGPGAPKDKDGVIFVAEVKRGGNSAEVSDLKLTSKARLQRQIEATEFVLKTLLEALSES